MKRAASSVELLTRIGLSRMLSASMVISTISPTTIPPFQTRHFKSGHSRVVLNLTEVVASANAGRVLTQHQSEFLIGGALSLTRNRSFLAEPLFLIFDFAHFEQQIYEQLVTDFVAGKVS